MLLKTEAAYRVVQSSLDLCLGALASGGLTSSGGQLHGIFVGIIINEL